MTLSIHSQFKAFGIALHPQILTTVAVLAALSSAVGLAPVARAQSPLDICDNAGLSSESNLWITCQEIRYIGFGTFNDLGFLPPSWNIMIAIQPGATGGLELAEKRHFFAHGPFVFTTLTDRRQHADMVVRAAAALDSLRATRPSAYDFLTSTLRFPTAPPLANVDRIDRSSAIIISFDKTPNSIAASTQVDGAYTIVSNMRQYINIGLISIDEITINGSDPIVGSRRIYGNPDNYENYNMYMRDGILFSIVHEMVHLSISQTRGSNSLASAIWAGRNELGAARQQATDAEEVIANETAVQLLGSFMSEDMTDAVRNENMLLARKPGVRNRLSQYAAVPVGAASLLVVPQ